MAIAVIGTGLAGLACATVLRAAGEDVVLFDKSRGYGGRMASRRRDGCAFDHGLPAFDPVATGTIPALGDLPIWGDHGRVASPRMNAFPREIGEGFESHMGARITRIDPRTLALTDDTDARHEGFSRIAVAIPAPQARDLLSGPAFAPLDAVTYTPCWTLLLGGVEGQSAQRMEPPDGPLALVIRDDAKPGRATPVPCWVAHARADWSIANLEREADDVAKDLCKAFASLTGLDPATASYRAAHRWRFCRPERSALHPFLLSEDARIGACGDWCGADRSGGDARAAWHSGEALGYAMSGIGPARNLSTVPHSTAAHPHSRSCPAPRSTGTS